MGQKPGSTDISVEPIWPSFSFTNQILISTEMGQLVAIRYGGLPFCWLCRPSSDSDYSGLQVGLILFGPRCKKEPGLRLES